MVRVWDLLWVLVALPSLAAAMNTYTHLHPTSTGQVHKGLSRGGGGSEPFVAQGNFKSCASAQSLSHNHCQAEIARTVLYQHLVNERIHSTQEGGQLPLKERGQVAVPLVDKSTTVVSFVNHLILRPVSSLMTWGDFKIPIGILLEDLTALGSGDGASGATLFCSKGCALMFKPIRDSTANGEFSFFQQLAPDLAELYKSGRPTAIQRLFAVVELQLNGDSLYWLIGSHALPGGFLVFPQTPSPLICDIKHHQISKNPACKEFFRQRKGLPIASVNQRHALVAEVLDDVVLLSRHKAIDWSFLYVVTDPPRDYSPEQLHPMAVGDDGKWHFVSIIDFLMELTLSRRAEGMIKVSKYGLNKFADYGLQNYLLFNRFMTCAAGCPSDPSVFTDTDNDKLSSARHECNGRDANLFRNTDICAVALHDVQAPLFLRQDKDKDDDKEKDTALRLNNSPPGGLSPPPTRRSSGGLSPPPTRRSSGQPTTHNNNNNNNNDDHLAP